MSKYKPNRKYHYCGGKRKDPSTIPGNTIPVDKQQTPLPTDTTFIPSEQELSKGLCKHELLIGTCFICKKLEEKKIKPMYVCWEETEDGIEMFYNGKEHKCCMWSGYFSDEEIIAHNLTHHKKEKE